MSNENDKQWQPIDERVQAYKDKLNVKRLEPQNREAWHSPPQESIHCTSCGDLGFYRLAVPATHKDFGRMFPCDNKQCEPGKAYRERQLVSRVKNSKLSKLYLQLTFESFKRIPQEQKNGKALGYYAARAFADNDGHYFTLGEVYERARVVPPDHLDLYASKNGLMLTGTNGVGKTGLAAAILNEAYERGEQVLYTTAKQLIKDVQERYGAAEYPSAPAVLEAFQKVPLLVIDEFEVMNRTDDRLEIIETVIRYRMGEALPLVMTSNLSQEQFRETWQNITASAAIGMAHWCEVAGLPLRNVSGEAYE